MTIIEDAVRADAGRACSPPEWVCVDGNEAAARVAHALSELIAIYPITPASPMGELADEWSAAGRANLWGAVPEVIQMQSEAGAAGALHGAVLKGALSTTFTSSQGLLLMLPNMFKIAGELTPAVIHVAARALATHALSIFGDHSDVMAARTTGWAMLSAGTVQEAHDFALVAHVAALRSRVPFLHFFDGFRTSHEIGKIQVLSPDDLRALVPQDAVLAHRARGLSPDSPVVRGTAQNPDVFFQAREAANQWHDAVPAIVQETMDALGARTGRHYGLVEYAGADDAEQVLIVMGSGGGAVAETVQELVRRGQKVGLLTVRLFRPFPVRHLVEALPATVRRVTVLDRTKEPGSVGEPLYADVVMALAEQDRGDILVTGARYGLGSKEFTPAMVKGVFDELDRPVPRRHVTVGIVDDVTHLSVTPDPSFEVAQPGLQVVAYGLGSDGTVGASKASVKMVGQRTELFSQGYFVYDSKKSGSVTASHLRFSPEPIRSTYLVTNADLISVNQFSLLRRRPVLPLARRGANVLLNAPYPAERVWAELPVEVQQEILDNDLRLYVVDAYRIARESQLAGRINTVMQTCMFALIDLLPVDEVEQVLIASARSAYARKGSAVVARNVEAIQNALAGLVAVEIPGTVVGDRHRTVAIPAQAPAFVHEVTARLLAGDGDLLPVSALPVDGTFPTDTARWEKPGLALESPVWTPDLCTGCGKCTIVCPHSAIRMKIFDAAAGAGLPEDFPSTKFASRELPGHRLGLAVSALDCTGCTLCVDACPAFSRTEPTHRALEMAGLDGRAEVEQRRFELLEALPEVDRGAVRHDTIKGSQLLQPLFAFSGACSGCGETPYLKLLSQLYGDRMIIANATGCSSIYGGNLPTTPWAKDANGRGPAWANSLFEDNAEFGLGIGLAAQGQHARALALLAEQAEAVGPELASRLLVAPATTEPELAQQRRLVAELKARLADLAPSLGSPLGQLRSLADELVERTLWIVGGDGWAYDIGYGGLDHVLASGRNVNILVLDSEVYSNTGGQASKATPRGALAKFAAAGKATAKKDLGVLAQAYGNVYVAQIALGANEMHTVRALREAQAWPGTSLVIAYSTCIEHGIDLATSITQQKDAVASGYWPLYRFRPEPAAGSQPFNLDSKPPTIAVRDFALSQTRFSALTRKNPEHAEELLTLMQADVDQRWHRYQELAGRDRP